MAVRKLIIFAVLCLVFSFLACYSQEKRTTNTGIIGGNCEGCEALLEYDNQALNSVDTLPGFKENNPKLKITGTVFKSDGKTPAENVILYIYHTNLEGIYPTKGNESGWAKRHGFIRGWAKTNKQGHYTFYTFRPAAYPNTSIPQHIHITVKEPNKNPYFIDDFLFADDPNLNTQMKDPNGKRGGTGLIFPNKQKGLWVAKRNIILGLNIPNYP